MRFIARARLALALGVASSASLRDRRWSAATRALVALIRELGWSVRAAPLSVGAERTAAHIESACAAVLDLVAVREGDPSLRARIPAVCAAVEAARASLPSLESVSR